MLTEYLNAAMHAAHYELIEDDSAFYAEIPGFQGVYANAATLEACRDELRVSRKLSLPAVDGLELRVTEIA